MRLLFFVIIIFIILIIFYKLTNKNMTYVKSDIDNNYYLVRDLPDKNIAVNMLAYNKQKIIKLINQLNDKKNNAPRHFDFELYTP